MGPGFDKLLVIAAMEEEERALAKELGSRPHGESALELSHKLGIQARTYRHGGREVHLVRSGMGPVNAALAVAMATERLAVDAVLLLGVGGALVPGLSIGDLVVSRRVLQHDYFASLDFGHARMRAGEIVFNQEQAEAHLATIDADSRLVEALAGTARVGTVLSGNEFVGTVERKRAIAVLHEEALLVEMEAAGVAQACLRLGLPFVVAKTVADRLQPDGSIESDFRRCLEAASANAATSLRSLLS
jgi:5'-methylthioadenosine/S-adenosylhomocysteine nucleosidase